MLCLGLMKGLEVGEDGGKINRGVKDEHVGLGGTARVGGKGRAGDYRRGQMGQAQKKKEKEGRRRRRRRRKERHLRC